MLFRSDIAGSVRWIKGQSASNFRSGEHLAATQHDALVPVPPGWARFIEYFRISIVRVQSTPDRSLKVVAANVPSGELSA